ncbi:MAG: hypothetical protein II525_07270 [Bacteroidales bacterium]|nr:hypothetical protein [Bacteroidales bacterium]
MGFAGFIARILFFFQKKRSVSLFYGNLRFNLKQHGSDRVPKQQKKNEFWQIIDAIFCHFAKILRVLAAYPYIFCIFAQNKNAASWTRTSLVESRK